ncbi:MAG: 23S rRNA (pseudouridine(1915)-N(3))-methyltransferase RlmH [Lautropia sp.]
MQIRIIAVGQRMPAWVDAAVDDYLKRLAGTMRIELVIVRTQPRGEAGALLAREAARIRQALPAGARVVALDERGEDVDSIALSRRLVRWREQAVPVAIVIGGPDGLDPALKRDAHESLRLSSLTLPHGLARVLLVEQLYRAWSIDANHPYHRE